MKSLSTLTLAVAVVVAVVLSGCKKEGCINKQALNYDSKAKKEDNSCTFSTVKFVADYSSLFPGGTFDSTYTIVEIDGATIGSFSGSGSVQKTLDNGITHIYTATTNAFYQGIETTYSEDGFVTASPTQSTITVTLYQ